MSTGPRLSPRQSPPSRGQAALSTTRTLWRGVSRKILEVALQQSAPWRFGAAFVLIKYP
jgi:hypothetical protein